VAVIRELPLIVIKVCMHLGIEGNVTSEHAGGDQLCSVMSRQRAVQMNEATQGCAYQSLVGLR